jgi:uncharacterized cysteine cluster protein YcgN (CxxCxxCC family)
MGVKEFVCDGCGRSFNKSGYDNHMRLRRVRIACKPLKGDRRG